MWKKIKEKFSQTLGDRLKRIFIKSKIDASTLEELETLLLESDVGYTVTKQIIDNVKYKKDEPIESIVKTIEDILTPYEKPFLNNPHPLNIVLICGVNGSGKTTSIAKLGYYLNSKIATLSKNHTSMKVAFAACDTFRAAAIEQLEIWANNLNIPLYKGNPGEDPASVAYKAIESAKKDGIQTLLLDTAGRLHNKIDLMNELKKIIKVIQKIDPNAPHEIILVTDATTGGNMMNQIQLFGEVAPLTGLIVNKLDGTAKAGILINAAQKFKIPIYFLGVGEKKEDLDVFKASEFALNIVE